jgi:peptide/nickel transport system ATP-binding protein
MTTGASTSPLLSVRDLGVAFAGLEADVHAVDGVSFDLAPGETLALVGESGSGKTVTALALMGLLAAGTTRMSCTHVLFEGVDLSRADRETLRRLRGDRIGMIFQEPMTSLNPLMRIGAQVDETLMVHRRLGRQAARTRTLELLAMVQLPDPEALAEAYPHQLSGGMRQRVMIAMALACEPSLLIADEPTTALDVTVQAQILALLSRLKDRLGMALILITHDLGVVAEIADRVLVMYAGRAVESGSVDDVLDRPAHPYTLGLLQSTIRLGGDPGSRLPEIAGTVPVIHCPPERCTFAPRCPRAAPLCEDARPAERTLGPGRWAACARLGADG